MPPSKSNRWRWLAVFACAFFAITQTSRSELPQVTYLAFTPSSFVEIDDSDALDLNGGAFTISAWIRPSSWGENQQGRIVDHGGGSPGAEGWTFAIDNKASLGAPSALRVQINNELNPKLLSDVGSVSLGVWQHVAVTLDAGTLTMYVDGVERGIYSGVPTPAPRTDPVRIGGRATDTMRGFLGDIDEVRIWNRALTQQEINDGMLVELTGLETGLVGYYRLDRAAGQTAVDSTVSGNHGSLGETVLGEPLDPAWVFLTPPGNVPPSVDAGPDATVFRPTDSMTLDGTISDDGLPSGSVTTNWSHVSGPTNAIFASPTQEDTLATFPQLGTYVLRLTADDGADIWSDDVTIVAAPEPDVTPPAVTMTAPANGSTLTDLVTISATVTDNRVVSEVEFLVDGVIVDTLTSAPYSISWDSKEVGTGAHTITVLGRDADGNEGTDSISATVDNGAPVNLLSWTIESYLSGGSSAANWILEPASAEATQGSSSAFCTILLSDFVVDHATTASFSGTLGVTDSTDDDQIGLALGYQELGELYLFQWKRANPASPGPASLGMHVRRISTGGPLPTIDDLEGHVDTPVSTILAENDLRWESGVIYDFTVDFFPGGFDLTIDDPTDVNDTFWTINDTMFTSGNIGFYNCSQRNSAYRLASVLTPSASPCVVDADCDDADACNGTETCGVGGTCESGTALVCDDASDCTTDSCDPGTGCVNTPLTAGTSCEDGEICNGAETCDAVGVCQSGTLLGNGASCDDGDTCNGTDTCDGAGSCQNGIPLDCDDADACTLDACDPLGGCVHSPVSCDDGNPCTLDACNPAGGCEHTPVGAGMSCEDGLYCNGAETCDGVGVCLAGSDPCPGQSCDDFGDVCLAGAVAQMESGNLTVGGTAVTVNLSKNYMSPVVVATSQYSNNTTPVVTRVSNVTSTSFDVRLQNPSDGPVAAETVHWLVVEEGTWTIDGLKVEAHTYLSTFTDYAETTYFGQTQTYQQSYTAPVVLGQVMTENDPLWSVFWASGLSFLDPPSATELVTGKMVGEDPNRIRADETIGYIVFESGHGTVGGVEYDTALGPVTVRGVENAPPYVYNFGSPFASTPTVGLASQSAMIGGHGSWAYLYSSAPFTTTGVKLVVDEDQVGDSERKHVEEPLSYIVFAGPVDYPVAPDCVVDADCDDGDACNGAETCGGGGTCQSGTAPVCDDASDCTLDSCDPGSGCVNAPLAAGTSCEDGEFCNGAETCDAVGVCQSGTPLGNGASCDDGDTCNGTDICDGAGSCQNGTPLDCDDADACTLDACDPLGGCEHTPLSCDDGNPCTLDACNPAGGCEHTPVGAGASCEDGLYCNGAETCDGAGTCQAGSDPCPGQSCDDSGDVCLTGPVAQLESGNLTVGGTPVTVNLSKNYMSPVVVSTSQYSNNTTPVITRVSNVTSTSFDVRLQNPSNGPVAFETVHWLVVEEGAWTIDGVNVEAQTYLSTTTDYADTSYVGRTQTYQQSYTAPVVLGQVMTENDPLWSVFWASGTSLTSPPSATELVTGKMVGEDPNRIRADETIGYIVFETGHGTIGGVEFDTALGPVSVKGVENSPPYFYNFGSPFASTPTVGLATQSAMNGGHGSWGYLYSSAPFTTTNMTLAVDEDQVADNERTHTPEPLSYIVFAGPVVYPVAPDCFVDADCDDGDACNGAETCGGGGTCQSGTAPVCDDASDCTLDSCDPGSGCVNAPLAAGTSCEDGEFCNGAETCDAVGVCQSGTPLGNGASCDDGDTCNGTDICDGAGSCQNGTPLDCDDADACTLDACDPLGGCEHTPLSCDDGNPCTLDACNPAGGCEHTPVGAGASCEDGLYCNGAETCDGAGTCQAGGDPCPGQSCDDSGDVCLTGPVAQLESGNLTVGGTPVTVNLTKNYMSPVVVSTTQYSNNTTPVVTRVSNVTSTSFDVRLQNPSDGPVAAETVHWLVVEEGAWTIDGVKVEAQTYLSTITDFAETSYVGRTETYQHSYTAPVVLGQVMSENDPLWSVFWASGASLTSPPSATVLVTGKMVGEDPNRVRADETIGFIVFETGHGTIGGVEFDTALGPVSVKGVENSPPYFYNFGSPFASTPTVGLATQSAMNGPHGSWAYLYSSAPFTTTGVELAVDEDQVDDSERSHTAEPLSYIVFAGPVVYPLAPACVVDAECDDGDACNGAETCGVGGTCESGAALVCDDASDCTTDSCDPGSGCVNTPLASGTSCEDGDVCNGAETCDVAGVCQSGTPLGNGASCDDGLYCNGTETCDAGGVCQAGGDPCPGQTCDDFGDVCLTGPVAQLESGNLTIGGSYVTVNLSHVYTSPVVVATSQYSNNTTPVVTRVSNVTSTSFDIRLQNPSDGPVAAETVHWLVVEEGTWTIDGLKVEAHTYLSTFTDYAETTYFGQTQTYQQSYTAPAVLGQVMTENDPLWSVFWASGTSFLDPPSATELVTGKMVGEDPNRIRADETIGYVVFESGHGTIGGVEYDTALGPVSVRGVENGPPYFYSFVSPFTSTPSVALATQSAMKGGHGSWAYLYSSAPFTMANVRLAVDEDQVADSERKHVSEPLSYIVFGGPVVYPVIP